MPRPQEDDRRQDKDEGNKAVGDEVKDDEDARRANEDQGTGEAKPIRVPAPRGIEYKKINTACERSNVPIQVEWNILSNVMDGIALS